MRSSALSFSRRDLLRWGAALALTSASLGVQATDISKAVYHVDFADPERYSLTLTSVNNMLNAYEQELRDYDVQIVFVGFGTRFVTDDKKAGSDKKLDEKRAEYKGRLESLQKIRGVKLAVCNNSLQDFGIPEKNLYANVKVVPSGVAYIADLQKQGAAYLKIQ